MNMYASIVNFFNDGGAFMYPIMLVLALGVAISIERYFYLTLVRKSNRKSLNQILKILQSGDMQKAYSVVSNSSHAVNKMLYQGLMRYKTSKSREDIESAMEESMLEVIPRLEKRTHYLSTFANIATLLGLLGTIIGLIKAFTAVAQVDPALKAEILSTSISVAMNTTAFGLMVAIPLLLIYAVLQTKTTELIDSLEMATVKFANILMHSTKA